MGLFGDVAGGVATGGILPLAKMLLKKPGQPGYDTTPIINEANKSADTQDNMVKGLKTSLGGLNAPYQQAVHQNGLDQQAASRAASQKFLSDVGSAGDQMGENLNNSLTRHAFADQPALSAQLRENMAAGGGLARGAYDQGIMQQGQQVAGSLYNGQQDIANQQLQNRTDAMGQVYGVDQGNINNMYGNDLGATGQVYGNNRTDLTNQSNGLLGIEQNRSGNVLGALGAQTNANFGSQTAANQNESALKGALIGAGGTAAGAFFGGPVGATAVRGVTQPVGKNPTTGL